MMSFTDLCDYAHEIDVTIVWARMAGTYAAAVDAATRTVYLDNRLDQHPAELVSAFAHELGHLALGHVGPQDAKGEDRADEWAARRLISPVEYAAAERILGPNPFLLGVELGVTMRIVRAWQRVAASSPCVVSEPGVRLSSYSSRALPRVSGDEPDLLFDF
ncbi:hypothetical protein [Actinobaculum sp. 352]|uniref:hypothetical protein n=1 Tax=Actinobaculum sp. 352 TaxID=2490946 RepID=UPI000F7EEFBF|nr:hypothetical protein [Actinobaculum sp. 352]RTE47926.1 hypothetical protein EKN07_11750 [Actinobaculum sp. 352]